MSTLVSLLLAAVMNLLGGSIHQEIQKTANIEMIHCQSVLSVGAAQNINQNEQLFKVKEITYEN